MVGAGAVAAAFGNGFGAFHHKRAAGFAVSFEIAGSSGRFGLDRVFAVGIVGATIESAEATALLDHLAFPAEGAGDAG